MSYLRHRKSFPNKARIRTVRHRRLKKQQEEQRSAFERDQERTRQNWRKKTRSWSGLILSKIQKRKLKDIQQQQKDSEENLEKNNRQKAAENQQKAGRANGTTWQKR
jgi:hypothetical protein